MIQAPSGVGGEQAPRTAAASVAAMICCISTSASVLKSEICAAAPGRESFAPGADVPHAHRRAVLARLVGLLLREQRQQRRVLRPAALVMV